MNNNKPESSSDIIAEMRAFAKRCREENFGVAPECEAHYNEDDVEYLADRLEAAIIHHMDRLSRKVYEGPWYTPGYFLHGMPMRRPFGMDAAKDRPRDEIKNEPKPIDVRRLAQAEFDFG